MPMALSRKAALRAATVALLFLYAYNVYVIARRGADDADDYYEASYLPPMHGSARPDKHSTSVGAASMSTSCMNTVLYYYSSAALIWNMVLFSSPSPSKMNRRRHSLVVGSLALIALINISYRGECPSSPHSSDLGSNGIDAYDGHIVATRGDGTSHDGHRVRISFMLHDPDDAPYPDAFSKANYRCSDRPSLPPSLAGRTVLNFTTTITSDLNVAFMGDSIGAQFAQAFDAASLPKDSEKLRWTQGYRYLLDKDWVSECLTVTAPTRGGGTSSFWRLTGLMSEGNKQSFYLCDRFHHNNKGWAEHQALTLLDHSVFGEDYGSDGKTTSRPVGAYDAFVMRVPHGWLTLDEITFEGIIEEIKLSGQNLGASVAIISTLPLCNNVVTTDDWKRIEMINNSIRQFALDWEAPPPGEAGIRTVLVQEFGNYTSQIVWSNAHDIGLYNGTAPDFSVERWEQKATFFFDRLKGQGKWPPSKAQVCVSQKFWSNDRGEQCHLNRISVDGSHWCVNSLGARHSASIACLLGCVFNGDGKKDNNEMRRCERRCNDRFMSVVPVNEEWIGTQTTILAV